MRLKCIKMSGFKSFVDTTTVVLPSNLSAIVGPNGCGKSNIIDAVRWVMGESSAKQLRGESITDVIFNGSGSRKPVGQASVELVFDNSEGKLGGEYAGWGEISIKRKVTRDGQSNYYLNSDKCRRRDITDIFLGTGLGPRSYAIIEQGMISSLIDAKPEELRVYIEEAAGISKYKERRKDTENRIKRTKENLERLTDIREELGSQISRLERQAKFAKKYTELKKEERHSRAKLLALKWRDINNSTIDLSKTIAGYEVKIEKISAERSEFDGILEKHRIDYTELGDVLNIVQGRYYSVGSEVTRIEQTIQYARDRASKAEKDLEEIDQNLVETNENLILDQEKRNSLELELKNINPILEQILTIEKSSKSLLQNAEEATKAGQSKWDSFVQSSSEPVKQAEIQESRIGYLEQLMDRLDQKIEKIDIENKSLISSTFESDLDNFNEKIAKAELVVSQKVSSLEKITNQIEKTRQNYSLLDSGLNKSRTDLQALLGKKSSLESLERSLLDVDDNKKAWFKVNKIEKNLRLAEKIEVDSGWETAIEVVLGDCLQAVCVESIKNLNNISRASIEGEVVLIEASITDNEDCLLPDKAQPLLNKIKGENLNGYLSSILQGVFAIDSISSAFQIRDKLKIGQSIVTKDGFWLGKNWLRINSNKDLTKGVLRRKKELEFLEIELTSCRNHTSKIEQQKNSSEKNLRELEAHREKDRSSLTLKQNQYAELRSQANTIQMQLEHLTARQKRINDELKETCDQKKIEQEKLLDARRQLESAISSIEKNSKKREELLADRNKKMTSLEDARKLSDEHKDHAHEIAMRERAATTKLQSTLEGIARLKSQAARLNERRQQLQDSFCQDDSPNEDLKKELATQLNLRLQIEKELVDSRKKVENLEHLMRDIEQKRNILEVETQKERHLLEQQRLLAQDLATRSQTISEQITEYGFILEELLVLLPDELKLADLEQTIEKISSSIQRLGPINLAAIDEYSVESERKQYLDKQNDDLEEALTTLESAIRKIDRETRSRFKETFDLVNVSFQELFPKLFGGGHSYLELTSDDLLEAGVAIMARPPGKKNTTVHLLSGGEKAMTAIALVFSIFQLNPAPFCMLDEVDAPLDDSNVYRYAKIVEEMSSKVQIVYISHNKNAMEMANQLVGVTMHEAGVSRLVSVDVNQAIGLASVE